MYEPTEEELIEDGKEPIESSDGHQELLDTVLPANKAATLVASRLMRGAVIAAYLDAVRPGTDSVFTVWGSPERMKRWL